ncbi:hypothetical protein [Pseudomonas sp. B14-6]|uniref:PDC sensor domain-containing protein n=1 Tax=Pseudomonas sp. B14-6 TaxID=2738843 RepID=UPI00273FD0FA|nr:hypothetical protein [Pseudomonas sp. B14-6]
MNNLPEDTARQPEFRPRRLPATVISVAFMALVTISIISIYWIQAVQSKAYDISQAELVSGNLTRSIAQQATDTFDEANLILDELIERIHDNLLSPHELDKTQRLLKRRVFTTEQLHGLFFYDKDGNWILSSFDSKPDAANNADRDYFQFHKHNVTLSPESAKQYAAGQQGNGLFHFRDESTTAKGASEVSRWQL